MRRPLILLTLAALLLASSAAASRYTLRRGDTLGGVARRLGVSVDALARANGIKNPDRILAGQVLVVPPKNAPPPKSAPKAAKPVAVAAPPTPAPAPAMKPIVDAHLIATGVAPAYTVVKGDTGGAIAKRNNVKLSALANANPAINIDRLEVGMVLTLSRSMLIAGLA